MNTPRRRKHWRELIPNADGVGEISCVLVEYHIPEHLANRLTAELREQLNVHMAACKRCRSIRSMLDLAVDQEIEKRGLK